MIVNINKPYMNGDAHTQLQQVKGYLNSLADQLNYALSYVDEKQTEQTVTETVYYETSAKEETSQGSVHVIPCKAYSSADLVNSAYIYDTVHLPSNIGKVMYKLAREDLYNTYIKMELYVDLSTIKPIWTGYEPVGVVLIMSPTTLMGAAAGHGGYIPANLDEVIFTATMPLYDDVLGIFALELDCENNSNEGFRAKLRITATDGLYDRFVALDDHTTFVLDLEEYEI